MANDVMLDVSIVICTDGRVDSLKLVLESLKFQNYQQFEVCVVCGPTEDGTLEFLSSWPLPIKINRCPARNLSMSRNIGIKMSAGEIIAFLDDDSIPEPEWLAAIVAAYASPQVGGAGGFVLDHTGSRFQYMFGTANRLGAADLSWSRAAPEFNFPLSANYPHLLGANSSFRKSALLSIGGFDEEYEYYLDETDVALRIIDDGWHIIQIPGACVHHKYMPSEIRNEQKVLRSWYAVFKNKLYFSLINRHGYHTVEEAIEDAKKFLNNLERSCDWALNEGILTLSDKKRFSAEIDQAWKVGWERGLEGKRRLIHSDGQDGIPLVLRRYLSETATRSGRTYCLLSQDYPPKVVGGVGRYVSQLARGLAELGHQVHVITRGREHDRVDFEDGVWVHRLDIPNTISPSSPSEILAGVPPQISSYCTAVLAEINRIAIRRKIDCVYAPIWDCEAAAILERGSIPVVIGLQTTFELFLQSHPEYRANHDFMEHFARPVMALEKWVLAKADAIHAISGAILDHVQSGHNLSLQHKATVIPLGLEDYACQNISKPVDGSPKTIRILFVGRLEARKGIDLLLNVIPGLTERYEGLHFDIVGNDKIKSESGKTYSEQFLDTVSPSVAKNVSFHGEVSEDALRGFYQACDIFVAPSRFESFGLVFVEAMMFAKPVIGTCVGGIPEVVEDQCTGLLAEPENQESLDACLVELIENEDLRRQLGEAGRARYEARLSPQAFVGSTAKLMETLNGAQASSCFT